MSAEQEVAFHTAFDRQIAELRAVNERQKDAINGIYNRVGDIQKGFDLRHAVLTTRVGNLASVLEQGR
jgi:hypothetical protein